MPGVENAVTENKKSSAVALIADRTAYDVRYSYRPLARIAVVEHEHLLSYSFKAKSAFEYGSLLLMPDGF